VSEFPSAECSSHEDTMSSTAVLSQKIRIEFSNPDSGRMLQCLEKGFTFCITASQRHQAYALSLLCTSDFSFGGSLLHQMSVLHHIAQYTKPDSWFSRCRAQHEKMPTL